MAAIRTRGTRRRCRRFVIGFRSLGSARREGQDTQADDARLAGRFPTSASRPSMEPRMAIRPPARSLRPLVLVLIVLTTAAVSLAAPAKKPVPARSGSLPDSVLVRAAGREITVREFQNAWGTV